MSGPRPDLDDARDAVMAALAQRGTFLDDVSDGGGARRERLVSFTLGGRDFTATITPDDEDDES